MKIHHPSFFHLPLFQNEKRRQQAYQVFLKEKELADDGGWRNYPYRYTIAITIANTITPTIAIPAIITANASNAAITTGRLPHPSPYSHSSLLPPPSPSLSSPPLPPTPYSPLSLFTATTSSQT
jgi:hypothetical protein